MNEEVDAICRKIERMIWQAGQDILHYNRNGNMIDAAACKVRIKALRDALAVIAE